MIQSEQTGLDVAAGYIPSFMTESVERKQWRYSADGKAVSITVPWLSLEQLEAVSVQLKMRQEKYLYTLKVEYIVDVIAAAIERLLNRQDLLRKQAEQLLPIITGYAPEMIRLALTSYLKTFRKPQLLRFLQEDFHNYTVLDHFLPTPKGGFSKAYGPQLTVHIWAGNVPGLPLWSLISALLVKSVSIGKLPASEPLFAGLFVQAIADIDRELADCIAIIWWQGGDEEREEALFRQAELVLAYGSNATIASLRRRVPIQTRLIEFGSKLSLALVGREALDTGKVWKTAHAAALDIIAYDQQGCYSPHILYVEQGGAVSAEQFAYYVAHELEALEFRYPRRKQSVEESMRWAEKKQAAQLSSIQQKGLHHYSSEQYGQLQPLAASDADAAGNVHVVIGQNEHHWTVVFEHDGRITPSPLDRFVTVAAIDHLELVAERLVPFRSYVQTAGIAASPNRLFHIAEVLGREGITRISALGSMTSPEAGWHHDGRFNLADLVRIVDIELGAEQASEQYASYCD